MFGEKAKRIKFLEEEHTKALKLILELRQVLDCDEGEDMRVKAHALMLSHETLSNLVVGAANTMAKADKWFSEQPVKKVSKKKKV